MPHIKKISLPLTLCIIGILCLLNIFCFSKPNYIHATRTDINYIIDDANLFSDSDINSLNKTATEYCNKWNISNLVLTTNDTKGKATEDYVNDYYDNNIHDSLDYDNNCIILLIDLDNRVCNVVSYENAQDRMTASRCYDLEEALVSYLSNKDYYKAAQYFFNKVDNYLGTEVDDYHDYNDSNNSYDNYPTTNKSTDKNIFTQLWFQILLSLIIGLVGIGIMIGNSGGRVTTNSYTYLDQSTSKLTGKIDNYIRTTTTKVKKPSSNNNSSNGGHTGTTSGGSSFSSGGGHKF